MKNIVKIVAIATLSIAAIGVYAQEKVATSTDSQYDWINLPADNGVYGLGLNQAYDYIKKNKLKVKAKPIVAVIGGGVDIKHQGLESNIWKNKKDKTDGKDNDKNLLVDDTYGWNFLGSKDGSMLEKNLREGDREYLRLRSKYDDLFQDETGIFYYKRDKIERIYVDPKTIDLDEFNYFRLKVRPESSLSKYYGSYTIALLAREYAVIFKKELEGKYPESTDFTENQFKTVWDKTGPQNEYRNAAMYLMGMYFGFTKTDSFNKMFAFWGTNKHADQAWGKYQNDFAKASYDARKDVVGDNAADINDRAYGNPVLLTSSSTGGTMAAGVIAGKRGGSGNNPIATEAQIMTLVVSAESGEPNLKDMALAIRYAVDHGASVITLPEQNTLYTPTGKQWMSEALEYAQSKNVFVVVPAWDLSENIDQKQFFPRRDMIAGKTLDNLMVVSPSKKDGTPFLNSNYGAKNVDLYAPAEKIYAPYVGDTYQGGSGIIFSAATTAGVAALIKTYYPQLTAAQIREILINSCTSRKGVEVEKGIISNGKSTVDLYLFDELCVSGGILNAYNALVEAGKVAAKK